MLLHPDQNLPRPPAPFQDSAHYRTSEIHLATLVVKEFSVA